MLSNPISVHEKAQKIQDTDEKRHLYIRAIEIYQQELQDLDLLTFDSKAKKNLYNSYWNFSICLNEYANLLTNEELQKLRLSLFPFISSTFPMIEKFRCDEDDYGYILETILYFYEEIENFKINVDKSHKKKPIKLEDYKELLSYFNKLKISSVPLEMEKRLLIIKADTLYLIAELLPNTDKNNKIENLAMARNLYSELANYYSTDQQKYQEFMEDISICQNEIEKLDPKRRNQNNRRVLKNIDTNSSPCKETPYTKPTVPKNLWLQKFNDKSTDCSFFKPKKHWEKIFYSSMDSELQNNTPTLSSSN